jgi:hypothetical protein
MFPGWSARRRGPILLPAPASGAAVMAMPCRGWLAAVAGGRSSVHKIQIAASSRVASPAYWPAWEIATRLMEKA